MLFGSFLSASVLATVLGGTAPTAATAKSALMASTASVAVHYHTVDIDGIEIFFCEAGDPSKPTILLLHGFPSSSHMYRELIPLLSPYFRGTGLSRIGEQRRASRVQVRADVRQPEQPDGGVR
jgi:pimeloyl-ACP methyl ester carboxylesterase